MTKEYKKKFIEKNENIKDVKMKMLQYFLNLKRRRRRKIVKKNFDTTNKNLSIFSRKKQSLYEYLYKKSEKKFNERKSCKNDINKKFKIFYANGKNHKKRLKI